VTIWGEGEVLAIFGGGGDGRFLGGKMHGERIRFRKVLRLEEGSWTSSIICSGRGKKIIFRREGGKKMKRKKR